MSNFFFAIAAATLPVVLWALFIAWTSPRPFGFRRMGGMLILGSFSVFPVLLFHQVVLAWVTGLAEARGWVEAFPFWSSLLPPVAVVLFIVLFILLFSGLQSLWLLFFYRLPFFQNFSAISKKAHHLTPLVLVLGGFFAADLLLGTSLFYSALWSTLLFAILEEYFKFIINPFLVYRRLTSVAEAMASGMVVGLSFAWIENVFFFFRFGDAFSFDLFYVYRAVFTTLLHVSCSGLIGYFYGRSLFSGSILTDYEIENRSYGAFAGARRLFGFAKTTIFNHLSVTQGFFTAAFFHAFFNMLLYFDRPLLAGFLAMGLCSAVLYLLYSEGVQKNYGLVGTPALPTQDFEQLRLKISVLQHLAEIRKSTYTPPS